MKVFNILVDIADKVYLPSLQPNTFAILRQLKRSWIVLFYGSCWLLMIAKLIFQPDNDFYKMTIFTSTTIIVLRIIYFMFIKPDILNLQREIIEMFAVEKSKVYLDAAETKMKKFTKYLVVLLSPTVLATVITIIFNDILVVPLYKPESWNYSGVLRILYTIIQCGCSYYGYVALWTFNLIIIYFMIHIQELSKFIGTEFAAMMTNENLKNCVEIHSNFMK